MYHAYNHKVGIQFVNHKYDCMITDRIGQHEVLLPINQNYDKFEKETRHRLYVSIKKKTINSAKCETTVHKNDAFFPLTQA